MNKIGVFIALTILLGVTFATDLTATANVVASSGSFGEYASPNGVMVFNQTSQTSIWTLVSTYNAPISFYITVPILSGATITVSAMNGTIPANSTFPITVTATANSNSTGTLTAYLIAYANVKPNSSGATIQLATSKRIQIEGYSAPVAVQSGGSYYSGGSSGGGYAGFVSGATAQNNTTAPSANNSSTVNTTAQNSDIPKNGTSSASWPVFPNYTQNNTTSANNSPAILPTAGIYPVANISNDQMNGLYALYIAIGLVLVAGVWVVLHRGFNGKPPVEKMEWGV